MYSICYIFNKNYFILFSFPSDYHLACLFLSQLLIVTGYTSGLDGYVSSFIHSMRNLCKSDVGRNCEKDERGMFPRPLLVQLCYLHRLFWSQFFSIWSQNYFKGSWMQGSWVEICYWRLINIESSSLYVRLGNGKLCETIMSWHSFSCY